MKTSITFTRMLMFALLTLAVWSLKAQPTYQCVAKNDTLLNDHVYQFDIYIYQTGGAPLFLTSYQMSFSFSHAMANGGNITGSYVAGSSELTGFEPTGVNTLGTYPNVWMVRINGPAVYQYDPGIYIPASPGLKVGTFQIIDNASSFATGKLNLVWSYTGPYQTLAFAYVAGDPNNQYPEITNFPGSYTTAFTNPVMFQPLAIFNVTGAGSYCPSEPGRDIGLDGSETDVRYRLVKNGTPTPADKCLYGTGGSLDFGIQTAGSYDITAYRIETYLTATMTGPAVVIAEPIPVCGGTVNTVFDNGACYATYVLTPPATSSYCGQYQISKDILDNYQYPQGTTIVTWTCTDRLGYTTVCTQNVIVTDNQNPVIVCPDNVQTNCQDDIDIPPLLNATATGNCNIVSITYHDETNQDPDYNNIGHWVYDITRTFTATDALGHTDVCIQMIHHNGSGAQINTTPYEADLGPDGTVKVYPNDVNNGSIAPCSPDWVNLEFQGPGKTMKDYVGYLLYHCSDIGNHTVVLVLIDIEGNPYQATAVVTVADKIPPTFDCPHPQTLPLDPTNCQITVPDLITGLTGSDNCGTVTFTQDPLPGTLISLPNGGTTTVVVTADDTHGNLVPCNVILTANDVTAPIITCPSPDPFYYTDAGKCTKELTFTATATDNCSTPSIAYFVNQLPITFPYLFPVGNTTVTAIATDENNLTSSCDFIVSVFDIELPVINCPHTGLRVDNDPNSCGAIVNYPPATATDNCGEPIIIEYAADQDPASPGSYFPVGTTHIVAFATDVNDNVNSCAFNIKVTDNEIPVVVCPDDINHTADAGLCSYAVSLMATADDNCAVDYITGVRSDAPLGLNDPYPVGTTTIVWTSTDIYGNVSKACTQTIIVTDDEYPVITYCPANINHTADGGLCSYLIDPGMALATDNCLGVAVTGVRSDAPFGLNDPYPVGTTTITWTATDIYSHSVHCTQTINVTDDEIPVVHCPDDINHTANVGLCSYAVPLMATAHDNCAVDHITGIRSDAQLGFGLNDPYPVGTTTIVWTSTDIHGHVSLPCTQTIIVTDDELPVITFCPGDINHTADAGLCSYLVDPGMALATDNCPGVTVTGVRSDAPLGLNDPYPVGTTIITWTATDVYSHSVYRTQNITVSDDEYPIITCGDDVSVTNDLGNCQAYVDVPPPTYVFDNCTISEVNNDGLGNGTNSASGYYPVGPTVVTWTAVDIYGHASYCQQNVTVTDAEPPHLTCPADISVTADPGACDATIQVPPIGIIENCGVSEISNTGLGNGTDDASGMYPVAVTTVTWTVADINGNVSVCQQLITVTDNEAPHLTCPPDISTTADPSVCNAAISVPPIGIFEACGVSEISNDGLGNGTDDASGVYPVKVTTVTWTVADINGNVSACQQLITVTDNEVPWIDCAPDQSQNNYPGLCTASVTVIEPDKGDNCGVASLVSDHPSVTYNVGTTMVTWTVTDIHGNFNTCQQNITVNDIDLPVIVCGLDVVQNNYAGVCNALVHVPVPTVSDNCSILPGSINNDRMGGGSADDVYAVGTATVTWTVMDTNNNINQCIQHIKVIDNEPPSIICPPDLTLCYPNTNDPIGFATATDNCEVASIADNRSAFHLGDNFVTYTATDIHGNITTCIQRVNLSYPISVSISQSELPTYCQNENVTLTATQSGSPGTILYHWSTGENTQSINVLSGTYSVTVTNTWLCTATATYTFSVNINNLFSSYTMLVQNEIHLNGDIVYEGGIGSRGDYYYHHGGMIDADDQTQITAPGTFARANQIYVDHTSAITNKTYSPVPVAWPPFQYMPYHSTVSVYVPANTTMYLGDTLYQQVRIGENATAIFTKPVVNIEHHLQMEENSTLKFATCATVRLKDDLTTEENVNINPDNYSVIFYVTHDIRFDAGGRVSGIFYLCNEDRNFWYWFNHNIYIDDSRKDRPGMYKVLLMANNINVKKNNYFYMAPSCSNCPANPNYGPFACPANLNLCNEDSTAILLNLLPPYGNVSTITNNQPWKFPVGVTTVTWTVRITDGTVIHCTQLVTRSPKIGVGISSSGSFCEGTQVDLNATVTGAPTASLIWSTGATSPSVSVITSGTYSATASNSYGCHGSGTITINLNTQTAASSYVMLANDQVTMQQTTVASGGVGVLNSSYCGNSITAQTNTAVTAAGTFAKALHINLDASSAITLKYFASASVFLPPFETNTTAATTNITVPDNTTATMTGSLYNNITVGKNATLILTQAAVNVWGNISLKQGSNFRFTQCTHIRVRGAISTDPLVSVNPDSLSVVFFVGNNVNFGAGAHVFGIFYLGSTNGLNYTFQTGNSHTTRAGIYKGVFLARQINSCPNTLWYLDPNCGSCIHLKELETSETGNSDNMILQNYPNPFSAKTTLLFVLPQDNKVKVEVFDLSGKLVQTLYNADVNKNQEYRVEFDGTALPSGIYMYKMTTNDDVYTGKMILSKE